MRICLAGHVFLNDISQNLLKVLPTTLSAWNFSVTRFYSFRYSNGCFERFSSAQRSPKCLHTIISCPLPCPFWREGCRERRGTKQKLFQWPLKAASSGSMYGSSYGREYNVNALIVFPSEHSFHTASRKETFQKPVFWEDLKSVWTFQL